MPNMENKHVCILMSCLNYRLLPFSSKLNSPKFLSFLRDNSYIRIIVYEQNNMKTEYKVKFYD